MCFSLNYNSKQQAIVADNSLAGSFVILNVLSEVEEVGHSCSVVLILDLVPVYSVGPSDSYWKPINQSQSNKKT